MKRNVSKAVSCYKKAAAAGWAEGDVWLGHGCGLQLVVEAVAAVPAAPATKHGDSSTVAAAAPSHGDCSMRTIVAALPLPDLFRLRDGNEVGAMLRCADPGSTHRKMV